MSKVQEKPGAPGIKVDRSGNRVRLRNLDYALEGCISTRQGDTRYRLEPNKWTTVPDEVYSLLKQKFYTAQETEVMDWNGDVNNPVRTPRTEESLEYIIEFPNEK